MLMNRKLTRYKNRIIYGLCVVLLAVFMGGCSHGNNGNVSSEAEWKDYFNNDDNLMITDVKMPVEKAQLIWRKDFTDSKNRTAQPSIQIIADDALVVMCQNKKIYKLDPDNGNIIKEADMCAAPDWGYTSPTYAQGLIFAPLTDGTIQIFNAKSLESEGIYQNETGGQALSPVKYYDGYIYTGFWNGDSETAEYVCLNVNDIKNSATDISHASHSQVWKYENKGGFYWSGAYISDKYIVFGMDDGVDNNTTGDGHIVVMDRREGQMVSDITLSNMSDVRCSISHDTQMGRLYFTTTGGYVCSAAFDDESGKLSDLKSVRYSGRITMAPVIYNNNMYFSYGDGFDNPGHFVVADKDNLEALYEVTLRATPQVSPLLTTAYENNGYLYFYTTYNARPGGITQIKISTDVNSSETAAVQELFEPEDYSDYCISNIVCSKKGILYYKNDSGSIFAVGDIQR